MLKTNCFLLLLCIFSTFVYSQDDKLKYLALGDSYTDATAELRKNGWPQQLTMYLAKKNVTFGEPKIVAGPGWTSGKLIEEIKNAELQPPYDLVSLMIGVNNQYRELSIGTFAEELNILIEKSISLAGNHPEKVILISIPDWGVTPFAKLKNKSKIAKEIKEFNTIIEKQAKKMNITYIDVTPSSRNMEVNKNLIASDSLHPSKRMYQVWAKKMSKVLLKKKSF